jgi:hypothetical protein
MALWKIGDKNMSTRYVISIDPGKTTGACLVEWSGNQDDLPILKMSAELQAEEFATWVELALSIAFSSSQSYDSVNVVCERFVITAQTVRNSQAPFSLEQIGVLKHLCRSNEFGAEKIVFQAPVDAKAMFSNESLKKIGTWHKGGEGHALDAIRHALLRLAKSGWKPRILLQ